MQNSFETPMYDYPEVPRYPMMRQYDTPQGPVWHEDPYAWLANYATDPEAMAILEAQNDFTNRYFSQTGGDMERQLEEAFEALTYGGIEHNIGVRRGDKTYFMRNDPHEEFAKLVVSRNGTEEVMIDVNTMEKGTSLMWFNVSPDDNWLAYSVMKNDREEPSVYLRNVENNEEELFYSGDHFVMDWDHDGKGFTYVTSNGRNHNTSNYFYQSLHHHVMGEDRQQDVVLLDAAKTEIGHDAMLGFDRSEDGEHVLVGAYRRGKNIDVYLLDAQKQKVEQLFPETSGRNVGFLLDEHVYVHIDTGDDKQRVVRSPIKEAAGKPLAGWENFIPSHKDHYIKSVHVTKSNFVIEYAHEVDSKVVLFDRQSGKPAKQLPIPDHTGLFAIQTEPGSDTFDYALSNALMRQEVHRYDGNTAEQLFGAHHNLNPDDYEIVKRSYESDDGTRIPLYLAAARGVLEEEDAAVLMHAYGGFMNGAFPEKHYTNVHRMWLKLGQIVAIPCIRGGNEFGKGWHETAVREHKPRTIEDINAASRYILDKQLSQRIGLHGGSNGGAMVLAAMMRQPRSYRSVESRVPLTDMLEYVNFPGPAEHWTGEFGDPRKPEELRWLRDWSPYHNIETNTEYPPLLITTGLNDTRVDAAHAVKMAARMQYLSPNSLTLLHVNPDTGHGHGMSASQFHASFARRLAFHALHLNVAFDEQRLAS